MPEKSEIEEAIKEKTRKLIFDSITINSDVGYIF